MYRPSILLVGALTTLVPMLAAFSVARWALRWDVFTALGAICGAMTSTPGLGVVAKMSRSQASSLAYVAVYPTALIGITIGLHLLDDPDQIGAVREVAVVQREARIEIVRILIESGANPNVRGRNGHTALELAAAEGREQMLRLFRKNEAR